MRASVYLLVRAVAILVTAFLFAGAPLQADAAVKRGMPLPDFRLFSVNGEPVSSQGLKGSVVILDFWATWCPHCKQAMPFLNDLQQRYGKQGLQVIGMSVDELPPQSIKAYAAEKRLEYLVVMAPRRIQEEFGIRALPVLFVVNRDGVVVEQMLGFSDVHGRILENLVKKLLQK